MEISQHCLKCSKRVVWILLFLNIFLFVLKLIFSYFCNSRSLIGDTLESLANVAIDIIFLLSLSLADKEPNDKFQYGYGKIEFLTSGIINLLLILVVIYFMIFSFVEMITIRNENPSDMIAILPELISLVAGQFSFKYSSCVGKKLKSSSLLTIALVSRVDMICSGAVIIAIIGTNLGIYKFDHIISLFIGALIFRDVAVDLKNAIKELMDYSLDTHSTEIKNLIKNIGDIKGIKNIKTRNINRKILADLEIYIPGELALAKGLEIVQKIKNEILLHKPDIAEVSVQLIPFEQQEKLNYKLKQVFAE